MIPLRLIIVFFAMLLLCFNCKKNPTTSIANRLSLGTGQIKQYSYTVDPNTAYLLQLKQDLSNNEGCTMYLVVDDDSNAGRFYYNATAPDADDSVHLLVNSNDSDEVLTIAVYSLENCIMAGIPEIIASQPQSEVAKTINNFKGQVIDVNGTRLSYNNFRYSAIGNSLFLHDVTERGETGLNQWSSITTVRFSPNSFNGNDFKLEMVESDNLAQIENNSAVDAHANTQRTFRYLRDILNLRSFDNSGSAMVSVVELLYPYVTTEFCGAEHTPDSNLFKDNAFWTGRFIAYTKSDVFAGTLASALDVSAHEWGHAITNSYSNLIYANESGALNEAYSDWLGVTTREYYSNTPNWSIGDIYSTFRSLEHPNQYSDPDTYMDDYWKPFCTNPNICLNDFCGVHSNSGVPNKMFYLLSAGGEHNDVVVVGIGTELAMQIATDANRFYWTQSATFASAKDGMLLAAQSYSEEVAQQVRLAWEAVGVY